MQTLFGTNKKTHSKSYTLTDTFTIDAANIVSICSTKFATNDVPVNPTNQVSFTAANHTAHFSPIKPSKPTTFFYSFASTHFSAIQRSDNAASSCTFFATINSTYILAYIPTKLPTH